MLESYIFSKPLRSFSEDKQQHYCGDIVLG